MKKNKSGFADTWRRHKYKYIMIAPFGIIFVIFTLLPVLVSIVFSFTSFNMVEAPEFVGWSNYLDLIVYDSVFLTAIKTRCSLPSSRGRSVILCVSCLPGW